MKPFLVTATDRHGRRDSFVREAESLPHLRNLLDREGYTDVEYLDDEYSAGLRSQTPAKFRDDSPAGARHEAKQRSGGSGGASWGMALRKFWLLLLVNAGLVVYGLWNGRAWPVVLGLVVIAILLLLTRAAMGGSEDYNDLLRAHARGDAEEARRLIEKLEADTSIAEVSQLKSDLAFRRAYFKAKAGDLSGAIADVQPLRETPECAQGAFEGRVASLHYGAGDIAGYLDSMERSYEASGKAASQRLDLAFGHARVGDAKRARELLAGVDTSLMPPFVAPLAIAAEGVLLEREGQAAAGVEALQEAVRASDGFSANPAFLPFHGIIVARLAAALARAGRRAEAAVAIQPWRDVALNCTDPDTRRLLETELEA